MHCHMNFIATWYDCKDVCMKKSTGILALESGEPCFLAKNGLQVIWLLTSSGY